MKGEEEETYRGSELGQIRRQTSDESADAQPRCQAGGALDHGSGNPIHRGIVVVLAPISSEVRPA